MKQAVLGCVGLLSMSETRRVKEPLPHFLFEIGGRSGECATFGMTTHFLRLAVAWKQPHGRFDISCALELKLDSPYFVLLDYGGANYLKESGRLRKICIF